jgi:hypothetical protein
MFFLMFFFSFWVHGVSYRFHALKIPLLSFIIGSQIWMENQGYFKASLRRRLLLSTYCLSWLLPWIYTSSSLMDHRISSILILASCMSAYNRLPPSNRVHAFVCILIVFCNIYNWLSLSNRVQASVLLSSTKNHKSFSNFLLIADFFLSLLLLSLFMIYSAYLAIVSA